ncbi:MULTISPECIES: NAD(P)/FAD-dependent oxidoreductase [Ectothiorhodospira]|uniref:NAD(P)/FAD-dependent oxidoreductase n=1 Tax=Ectothiorhodospira TaxID=1051 RepID=UPI001EE90A6A|nr:MULTISPECIES: FAD/NAD(P)-binding oxidoreductase [Ectothiorhodospira]MCG5494115.1 FAD-dependent oxidoreductase [Ectothiorhodospira variabilis]MCG5497346.1 FAD-dependent oxidoreductase [Ectothiorhodospira variabilis]MCG5503355.1 FAD-dependent oxidoreductase [Ectothiorhodospira variabilis]MCG5506557.1 FAD-dependent oxidoreductase [Ectothiorhodospira variabilis]MCG5524233.1 FAD-dependent oxidoreductase [Ectothiorhodospira haloalkaliphila]
MNHKDKQIQSAVQRALGDKGLSRRDFLRLSGGGALLAGAATSGLLYPGTARAVSTNARIVIVGAGAAGLSCATRLNRELEGAQITLIDRREDHYYQPGLTLVATGVWNTAKTLDSNRRYVPSGVNWIHDMVAEYDPDNNRVITDDGRTVEYDYLMVTTGLQVNYDQVEGMSEELIGQRGVGCVYDKPELAERTWRAVDEFVDNGGVGLFTRPRGDIKCAGAPLKVTMLTESRMKERGTRDKAEMHYLPPGASLFSQPDADDFLSKNFPERGIQIHWDHPLTAIDPDAKTATFDTPLGNETLDYDFIHVVPPMSAPDSLRESELAAQEAPFKGWLEVDRHTLQHNRYANVFGAGDINGVPIGKTAASVKSQVPVAVENMIQAIQGRENSASYDGYTSCPLITELGKAILVEFDYDLKMKPSFPVISPYEEHWVPWVMKDRLLLAAYRAMLRGRI